MNNNGDFELKIGDIKDELDEVKIEISPRKFKKILEEIKEIAEENPPSLTVLILKSFLDTKKSGFSLLILLRVYSYV